MQAGSAIRPASCPRVPEAHSIGVKTARGLKLNTHLRPVQRWRMVEICFHSSILLHGIVLINLAQEQLCLYRLLGTRCWYTRVIFERSGWKWSWSVSRHSLGKPDEIRKTQSSCRTIWRRLETGCIQDSVSADLTPVSHMTSELKAFFLNLLAALPGLWFPNNGGRFRRFVFKWKLNCLFYFSLSTCFCILLLIVCLYEQRSTFGSM